MNPRLIEIRKRLLEIKKRKMELRADAQNADDKKLDEIADETAKLDNEEIALEEEAQTVEKRSALLNRLSSGQGAGSAIELPDGDGFQQRVYGIDSKEYRSAFFKTLAGVELNDVEKRAMTTNTNSAGYAVPTITMNKVYEKLTQDAIAYNLVTVSHLKGNVVIPIEGTTADIQRKAEGADSTLADDTIESLRLGAKKYIKTIKLTCELANTAIDALEDFVVKRLADKLLLGIDYDIINGTGTNGAKGILSTITPIQTASTGKIGYDDLCDLFAALPARAKKNATLMLSTNTLYGQVKKIKDNENRPIFDVHENKILGRTPVENDDVPDGTIIFGDFSTYMFNWSKEAELKKSEENAFMSGDTVFRILALADGGLMDLGAMKALKVKTSGSGSASGSASGSGSGSASGSGS